MKLKRIGIVVLFIVIFTLLIKSAIYNFVFPYKYGSIVNKYAKEYNLDPLLVLAVIKAESNFNTSAKSHKDAHGLMQITDSTAKWASEKMNIGDYDKIKLQNPDFNIRMGN